MRKYYIAVGIFTTVALTACLIKSVIVKEWFLVFCNSLWIISNTCAFAIYNRAEVLKNNIYKRLDEYEKRDNESEN